MSSERRSSARLVALALVFHLAGIALVGPLLVLCEDGERHTAVESAMALCCSERRADSGDAARPPASADSGNDDCSGSCTDTPFLTAFDATSPKRVTQAVAPGAPVATAVRVTSPPPALAGDETEMSGFPCSPHLGRSSVLRI